MENWKRTFYIIWSGQFVSILSSIIAGYAMVLWISLETNSAEALAIGTIAVLLPQALIGPFAGVYIDRWDRKTVMIISDMFVAMVTLGLIAAFTLGFKSLWLIYLMFALRSVGSAFHSPAMSASVPMLAPGTEITRISGINQMLQSIGNIAGPPIAALMIVAIDIRIILSLDIIGAAVACFSLLMVKIPSPEQKPDRERSVLREMNEGLQEILSQKGIFMLIVISVLSMIFIMPVSAIFPLMTLNHFKGTTLQVGIVEVAWGLGMLLGGALLGINRKPLNKVLLINAMYILTGSTFFSSGLLSGQDYWIFVAITGVMGISASLSSASITAIMQENFPPDRLGRIFSLFMSAFIIPSAIGLLGTGFLADNIGMTSTFVISGCIIMTLGVISFFIPAIKSFAKKNGVKG
jgi:DHA3 family macrolide efflux protein-like MFS transporter